MKLKVYKEEKFTGERALFQSSQIYIEDCTFADGESPLKESSNIEINGSLFRWKYPLWYCSDIKVDNSVLFEMARAGIWYTNNIMMSNSTIEAPKTFRRSQNIKLENVDLPNADETLWNCSKVSMKNVTAKGDYFAMGSTDLEIEDFTLVGNYSFDGAKNLTIRNAKILSKDAFWNSENVTVYNSFISGEYLGWNAKNVTLIDCTIESEQGMCYMENVVMKNCKLLNTDLAFEYSTVDATIESTIDSVKNPISGTIKAKDIGEVIFDDPAVDPAKTQIVFQKENSKMAV